jgi:hypothetical protein
MNVMHCFCASQNECPAHDQSSRTLSLPSLSENVMHAGGNAEPTDVRRAVRCGRHTGVRQHTFNLHIHNGTVSSPTPSTQARPEQSTHHGS